LSDGAFDGYMVYFYVVISALPLSVKIGVGTSSDCEDCAMSGEGVTLLLGFLDLWWRWRWWVGFDFNFKFSVVSLGRWFVELLEDTLFVELVEGTLFEELVKVTGWLVVA
jgi:hypothetical protein